MAETEDLKSFQCRFESDRGHHLSWGSLGLLDLSLAAFWLRFGGANLLEFCVQCT